MIKTVLESITGQTVHVCRGMHVGFPGPSVMEGRLQGYPKGWFAISGTGFNDHVDFWRFTAEDIMQIRITDNDIVIIARTNAVL